MHFLLFLVLASAVGLKGLQVHDPSDPVVAEVGRAVLLPCTAQKSLSLEALQVEWKKTDSDSVVIVFEKGKSKPELQSKSFKGRVDIFPDEMSKGNFSVLLQNVIKEDAGVYRCKVNTVQDSFETTVTIKTIDLLVVKGANRTTYDSVGDEVILNCSVNVPAQEIEEVTWKKKDGDLLVLLFQNNETFSDSSHESYRERAEFFITEIPKGNFSMKLKDVRVEDKGEFICEVHTRHASGSTTVVLQSVANLMIKGADQSIVATAGDEVILNCSVDSRLPVHEIEEVDWKKKDGDLLVLLFQNNEAFSDSSHESYQGRAEFFITEIPKGNFSLKLKNVRLEDKGEFICEILTSNTSTRTIVDLQSVDFSALHISVLVLCFAVMLFTVGFCLPTFNVLRKKVTNRTDLIMQATLILCPNICMFVAFILWSKEGFLYEVVICSAVCIARPIMLLKSSPFLNKLPGCLQKGVKAVAVPLHHSVIILPAFLIFFENISLQTVIEVAKAAILLGAVLCFITAVITAGFALRMYSSIALELSNGFLVALFVNAIPTPTYVGYDIVVTSILAPLIMALTMILCLQRHCFQRKPFKCVQLVLTTFLVGEYSTVNIYVYVVSATYIRNFSRGWELLFEAILFTMTWLAIALLLHFRKDDCLSLQRGKGYLCCAAVASVLIILYGIYSVYFTANVMENRQDRAGYLALTVLIHVLAVTSLFKHPNHLPDLPHIMIYMFGTVGLTLINSITLASELIMKAGKGARTIEDLRLIVLPCETVFISGWLTLQIYDTWMRTKDRIKHNFEDGNKTEPEVFPEMEPLSVHKNQLELIASRKYAAHSLL